LRGRRLLAQTPIGMRASPPGYGPIRGWLGCGGADIASWLIGSGLRFRERELHAQLDPG